MGVSFPGAYVVVAKNQKEGGGLKTKPFGVWLVDLI